MHGNIHFEEWVHTYTIKDLSFHNTIIQFIIRVDALNIVSYMYTHNVYQYTHIDNKVTAL